MIGNDKTQFIDTGCDHIHRRTPFLVEQLAGLEAPGWFSSDGVLEIVHPISTTHQRVYAAVGLNFHGVLAGKTSLGCIEIFGVVLAVQDELHCLNYQCTIKPTGLNVLLRLLLSLEVKPRGPQSTQGPHRIGRISPPKSHPVAFFPLVLGYLPVARSRLRRQ